MSKYHGEQYWTTVGHNTLQDWRDLNEDEFDTLQALRHDREVRERGLRDRARRGGQVDPKDLD